MTMALMAVEAAKAAGKNVWLAPYMSLLGLTFLVALCVLLALSGFDMSYEG
jgi:hypothetical protein